MITVTMSRDGKRLFLGSHYEYRFRIKKLPSAEFDRQTKMWVIPKSGIKALLEAFKGELYFRTPRWKILGELEPPKEEVTFFSDAENIEIPKLNLTPYDYQKHGIRFMIDRIDTLGFCLNADAVGLGKTIQSIGVVRHYMNKGEVKKVLVVCKKSLKSQWKSEFYKITGDEAFPVFVTGDSKAKRKKAYEGIFEASEGMLVTNYHSFLNDLDQLSRVKYDLVIIDEVHTIKGRKGKMNNAVQNAVKDCRKVIFLTGTPIMSRPDDIFGIIQIADKDYFGSYSAFNKEYIVAINGLYGYQIIGAKNLDKLSEKIKKFMIRRTQEDVSIQLPEVTIETVFAGKDKVQEAVLLEIESRSESINMQKERFLDNNGRAIPQYATDLQSLVDKEKQFLACKQFAADDPRIFSMSSSSARLNETLKELAPEKYKGSEKTELLVDLVDNIVSGENKVIVFTHFETSARLLEAEIKKKLGIEALMYTGKVSEAKRDENIRLFNESPEHMVLIGNDAMAEGLNLQVASYLINYEQADTYALKQQRIGRIRRAGSVHSHAHVFDVVTEDSYDTQKLKKIQRDKDLSESLIK